MPHVEALHTFGYHLTYNNEDAADLVQETYLKAYKFIDKYEQGTNAKAWLFKIMKNAYINDYRKRSKRPTQVDYEEMSAYHEGDDSQLSSYYDIREDLFEKVMGDEVTAAINALPEEFKSVIFLCDIEEFSYEEISKILEIPIGTVRSRLFRARNMLKELLKNYALKMGYKDLRGEKNSPGEEESEL
ncbi:MAG: sigma-70 family RNA polymerase sigma factor [Saprospiraceae bacterium]|nr:sigma-70 family RNA polymerase sigma factor [Saprospiraceae bacterium]